MTIMASHSNIIYITYIGMVLFQLNFKNTLHAKTMHAKNKKRNMINYLIKKYLIQIQNAKNNKK